jgi:hypothetical protein
MSHNGVVAEKQRLSNQYEGLLCTPPKGAQLKKRLGAQEIVAEIRLGSLITF